MVFWNAIWMSIFNQYRIVESLGRGIQAGSSVVLHGNEKSAGEREHPTVSR